MSNPLDPRLLLRGYASGIFPMADSRESDEVFWVEPRNRAILPLHRFHVSRSLSKVIRRGRFDVTCDRAFHAVLHGCAGRPETWINTDIERATLGLHAAGHAHSVECWSDGELAGGIYGIRLGRAFFGESMFSRMTDASKVALAWLVARLKVGHFTLLDCQFITPHLETLGATTVNREHYVGLLTTALSSAGGGVASDGAESLPVGISPAELLPPDFEALDDLLDSVGAAGAAGPAGQLIAQLLGHTS
ncbi:MAG TPA: leucyl/phenylalanyl-tRNA--protein transferase [Sphingomicrobium sp.]|nr:leucyl/phenylalanyl-tRNA--protein transferase [Sphingomicrobium sp.]